LGKEISTDRFGGFFSCLKWVKPLRKKHAISRPRPSYAGQTGWSAEWHEDRRALEVALSTAAGDVMEAGFTTGLPAAVENHFPINPAPRNGAIPVSAVEKGPQWPYLRPAWEARHEWSQQGRRAAWTRNGRRAHAEPGRKAYLLGRSAERRRRGAHNFFSFTRSATLGNWAGRHGMGVIHCAPTARSGLLAGGIPAMWAARIADVDYAPKPEQNARRWLKRLDDSWG